MPEGHVKALSQDFLSSETVARLRNCSTATLTTQLFKRGFRNLFVQGTRLQSLASANMVGLATTLRYIPAREDLDHLGVFEDRSHPQRKAVEDIEAGKVLVMDTRGDGRAASAGHILLSRMKVLGAAGVVTDGSLRDLPEIAAMNWPVYAAGGAAPTNLIHHHAVDIDVPIACGGVPVYPGDVVVGDAEGVVILPRQLADEVAEDAERQEKFEAFVLEEVRNGRSIFGLYPPNEETKRQYEALGGFRPKTHG